MAARAGAGHRARPDDPGVLTVPTETLCRTCTNTTCIQRTGSSYGRRYFCTLCRVQVRTYMAKGIDNTLPCKGELYEKRA